MSDYINKLPNELLLVIFNRIPLADLLPLDQICPRWSALLPTVYESRRTLVLILGELQLNEMQFAIPFNDDYQLSFDAYPYYDLSVQEHAASITWPYALSGYVSFEDYLEYDYYDEPEGFFDMLYRMEYPEEENNTELARFYAAFESQVQLGTYFSNLLPNLNKLVVIYAECNEQDVYSMCKLVGSCLPSLVTLKLWIQCIDFEYMRVHRARAGQHPVRLLLRTIAQQSSSLQELTLDICGSGNLNDLPEEICPFNVAQCKVLKLKLGNYDTHQWDAWESVNRADNVNLTQIGLGDYIREVDTLLDRRFTFTRKVTQLYCASEFDTAGQLSQFVGRYSSLRMLRMDWTVQDIRFSQLISNLASLKQLTHLYLSISFEGLQEEDAFAFVDRADEGNKQEETRRISLTSVKILTLDICKRSHLEFESLSPGVFPSVEAIMVRDQMSSCTTCQLDGRRGQGTGQCHRQLVISLKNKFVINSPPLLRLYSLRGFGYEPRIWHDWSMYMRRQDEDFLLIPDLEDDLPAVEEVEEVGDDVEDHQED